MNRWTVTGGLAAVCMATAVHADAQVDADAKAIAAMIGPKLNPSDVGKLQSARANGPNVEVAYVIDEKPADRKAFKNAQGDHAAAVLCEVDGIAKATTAGVTIEMTYRTPSGDEVATVIVGGVVCTAYQFKKTYNKYYPQKK